MENRKGAILRRSVIDKLFVAIGSAYQDLEQVTCADDDMPELKVFMVSGDVFQGVVEAVYPGSEDVLVVAQYEHKLSDDEFAISKIRIIPYHAIQSIEIVREGHE